MSRAGGQLKVASAGIIPKEGRSPCTISKEAAANLGVDISGHRSSILTTQMLDAFDTVVVMEASHLPAIRRLTRSALNKTFLLSAFDPSDDHIDVTDPYGGDRAEFTDCYLRVVRCVDTLHGLTAEHSQATNGRQGRHRAAPSEHA